MTNRADYAEKFLEPWNRHDVDGALAFLTQTAEWEFAAGSTIDGRRICGQRELHAFATNLFETMPDIHYELLRAYTGDDYVIMELLCTGTRKGEKLKWRAVDILTFDGEKVSLKRSYRKQLTQA